MEDKLLHKELTYVIRGLLFEVHNELGRFRNEKQYGDAFAAKLQTSAIAYEREKILPVSFVGEQKGRNRVDFFIENILIIELKCVPCFSREDYFQCQRYLASLDKELCILVNFRPKYLAVKRILNHKNWQP